MKEEYYTHMNRGSTTSLYFTMCEYKYKCRSYPHRCGTCKHNESFKDDYYEPKLRPYHPRYPYDPWYYKDYPPKWRRIKCVCGNGRIHRANKKKTS